MSYNHHQQGFNQSPGGVPYNGIPSFPDVPVGEVMQPHLPIMATKIYSDIVDRGTEYTNYMSNLYSQNGYHNELFEEIIVMVANFAEYSMATYNRTFHEVIDSVIQDCNNMLLEYNYRVNPQKIPVQVTEMEKNRYRAAKSKLDGLRIKMAEFLKHKESNMNNQFNQFPQQYQQNQPVQQPQYQQSTPQQQQHQWQSQQAQAHWQQQQAQMQQQQQQQAQAQAQWQQQQNQMNQQQYNNRQAYNGGRQQNDFVQRVQQRTAPQQQQWNQQPQQGQWQQPNQQQQWQHQQWQQQQNQMMNQQMMNPQGGGQFYNQQPHPSQHGFNPNQAASQQHHQPAPTMPSNTGYDPMPMVDEAKLAPQSQQDNSDPFAANAAIIKSQQHVGRAAPEKTNGQAPSFTAGASFSQQTKPNPSTSTSEERKYERKVRVKADELGLPEDASLSYLESEISRIDPKNGFISIRNAYSEAKGMAHSAPNNGNYSSSHDNVMSDESIEVFSVSGDYAHDSFAAKVLRETAAKSQGKLVTQANGRVIWMSFNDIQAFNQAHPHVDINTADLTRFKEEPPYTFAHQNMTGEWTVEAKHYRDIKLKGWYEKPVLYPVYSTVGYYVVSDKGVIKGFFSRPKTNKDTDMDYASHDDRRFFTALSPKDVERDNDDARMIQTFANLQVSQKVEEVIADVEKQAGVLEGDNTALIINKTIEFDEPVHGSLVEDDYYLYAKAAMSEAMGTIDYDTADVSYRFIHAHMYPWNVQSDEDIKAVRALRYKEDYTEISKVLIGFSEDDNFPGSWFNRLNDVATRYVNDVVSTQYPLLDDQFFFIKSFVLDIDAAIEEMDGFGYGESFRATAKRLTNTLLYVWDNTNPVYSNYFDLDENENDDSDSTKVSTAGFGILRDITVIPLHSRSVPLYSEEDKCLLTKHGFNSLWKIAKDRMDNRNARVTETLIVTSDNRHMYISETAVEDVFAITKKSILS